MKTPIPKQELKNDIKNIYLILGHPPTKTQYLKLGKYGINTIKRAWFGSWNNAMIETVGFVNKRSKRHKTKKQCPLCKKWFWDKFDRQIYCSISCSNSHKPKRSKTLHPCKHCQTMIPTRLLFCKSCKNAGKHLRGGTNLANKTIASVIYKTGSNKYGIIRNHAKTITKNRKQICLYCGYDKHVETCHIKDIVKFPLDTKIETVNDPHNLILLCPNCHWEFDHNLINLSKNH
jgi:predicted restriction endonuclease